MLRHLCVAGTIAACLLFPGPIHAAGLIAETSKDFGSVPQGQLLTHRFPLKNNTGQALHISSLRSSCQCASAGVEKHDVPAGESTNVVVTIDTGKYLGSKSFTVYVLIDRPSLQEIQLTVSAHSRGDVAIEPGVVDFGNIAQGSSPTATATVKFYTSGKTAVTGINSDNGYIDAKYETLAVEGYTAYQVKLKLRNDLPAGHWHADVWLKTNDSAMPKIRVPVLVRVEAALTVSPAEVSFARKPHSTLEKSVTVRSAKPCKIVRVEGADPAIQIRGLTDEAKTAHVITVVYSAGKEAPDVLRTFKVVTDLPSSVEFQVVAE